MMIPTVGVAKTEARRAAALRALDHIFGNLIHPHTPPDVVHLLQYNLSTGLRDLVGCEDCSSLGVVGDEACQCALDMAWLVDPDATDLESFLGPDGRIMRRPVADTSPL